MEPQRFHAQNTQEAFELVKAALGDEAIIISNRTVPDGVEIIAASETTMPDANELAPPVKSDNEFAHVGLKHETSSTGVSKRDLEELKDVILSEMAAVKIDSWHARDPNRHQLFKYFINLGFDIGLISKIVSLLDDGRSYESLKSDVLYELEWSVNCRSELSIAVQDLSGILMIHGMSGAGKTTTTAKIAAQVSAAHGPDSVVMVCADNRRMGAYQQLLGYGKILEIPVLHVRKSSELNEILSALKNTRLVIVDHAGMSPDEFHNLDNNVSFQCALPNIHHYLIVSATTQASSLNAVLSAPWKDRLDGVILTKVDEAVQLGEVISCLIRNHSPSVFMSDGQNIQMDLQQIEPTDLINRALEIKSLDANIISDSVTTAVKSMLHQQVDLTH